MPDPAPLFARYRVPALALIASAALHAAVMVGAPQRFEAIEEPASVVYAATLETVAAPAPPAPARPAPRPRRLSRPAAAVPADTLAALPVETATDSPSDASPDLQSPPDILALAQPAVPVPALEPPPAFPVDRLPPSLSIEYHLTSAFADGRASYEWEREGDSYRIRGEAEAEGFFTLFLEGRITQESRGSVTSAGLRPEHFSERRPNAEEEGLTFDWQGGKVAFEKGSQRRTGPLAGNTVDWLSMIFQLAHAPPASEAYQLQVYTQRRMYTFRLQVLGVEDIEIPLGRVRALHLRHEDTEKNEVVDVWLGIDQYNLPVKMRYPVARNRLMVEQVATRVDAR